MSKYRGKNKYCICLYSSEKTKVSKEEGYKFGQREVILKDFVI